MPKRSLNLPASGDTQDSITAPPRKMAAITVLLAPSRDSRSGASTSTTPKAMPASAISHMPLASRGSRSARRTSRGAGDPADSTGGGTANAAAISAAPATEAAENAGPVPTWVAAQPTTGPSSAPTTAAPNAVPSS